MAFRARTLDANPPNTLQFPDRDNASDTFRKEARAFRIKRELEAIEYVQRHTSISIPTVIEGYVPDSEEREFGWILMNRLPSQQLSKAWAQMSEDAKDQTSQELKLHLQQLRQLRSPPGSSGVVGSCSGGPVYDHRLDNRGTCGPFQSISDFNDSLVAPVLECPRPEWVGNYRSQLRDDFGIVFSHADLSVENILVDPASGSITGIIDWEMAGFWPEWWEYRKALFGSRTEHDWWVQLVQEA
ncbi:hypothetical protein PG988_007179 [Apiospora saccharicola]